ncbi:hypothetical protein BHE74_00046549, partial [Ensete ventricosum]
MYRSTRLPVHGPPATGRYRQNRPSVVDFDRRQSISTIGSRLREKKGRRRRRGKEETRKKRRRRKNILRRRCPQVAREPSPPSLAIFLPRGEKDRDN